MPTRKSRSPVSITEFIAGLPQPLRQEVEALRSAVVTSSKGIGEEIKWNAPSFYTGEHFATMRLNGKVPLQLILHLGVKKSFIPHDAIQDPENLLQWLGPDRACVSFSGPGAVAERASAVQHIVRQWVQHVPAANAR